MIFVTVGMHPIGFERLVRKMDEVAASLDEETIMQIGGTRFAPAHTRHFLYCTQDKMQELCRQARVVVTHGAMSIIDAGECGARVVAVPREKRFGEAIDDHQVYLVRELEKQGRVTAVFDIDRLSEALLQAGAAPSQVKRDRRLVEALRIHVAEMQGQSK